MPPATALLLEKLNSLRDAETGLDGACQAATYAESNLELATKHRADAFDKRSSARRALTDAQTALAAQLATMPLTPIRHKGETFVHVPGAGMQSFKGEPLALGVQS